MSAAATPNAVRPSSYSANRAVAPVTPSSVNVDARTAELIISTGAPVRRWFGTEVLDLAGVDASRLAGAGICLLDSHRTDSNAFRYGVVTAVRAEGAQLVASVRFDRTENGDRGLALAVEGSGVSIGYRVDEFTESIDPDTGVVTRTATRWTLFEVTLTTIAADGAAYVRAEAMSQTAPAPAAPAIVTPGTDDIARRQAAFTQIAGLFHRPVTEARRAAMNFPTAEDYRAFLIDERAAEDERTHTSSAWSDASSRDGQRTEAMIAAIAHKMNPSLALPDQAREYRGMSSVDMAREILETRGQRVRRMRPEQVIELAMRDIGPGHGTGDFPSLLNASGHRVLLDAYQLAASPLKALARQRTASDFRTLTALRLGEHPRLEEVPQHGEIGNVTMGEAKETYRVKSYANIFSLTLQALVNDDLNAFADFTKLQGMAAAETEAGLMVDLLVSNPVMDDTKTLFHADHGNLAASGAAISVATLSAARLAMRTQKGVDGVRLAPMMPRTLLVGAAKETEAELQLAALNATQASDVNPFSGKLELAVEPRLTGNGWYVFGDPAMGAVLEYAYLDGVPGPQMSFRDGWRTLGTEFRVVLHFGTGVVDWRGAFRNPGE